MKQKIIFFDIDGTLLPENGMPIPESTKEASAIRAAMILAFFTNFSLHSHWEAVSFASRHAIFRFARVCQKNRAASLKKEFKLFALPPGACGRAND